jgi:Tfp pilus assembly protein PilF
VKKAWLMGTVIVMLMLPACARRHVVSDFDFANRMVREGLWKEAAYRYQKAFAAGKNSAALHNNLAVAYENLGQLDEAETEYQKAMQLAPNDSRIKDNYKQFQRTRRQP